ncbi:hypothetical protein ACFSX9_13645 [Flavobacterium ardleyense]|uniref:Uncharacterized protein n=1 Tax=Flavobacterium ardleyense TaxID=2038737 RepID=A0ABW5ZBD2_9FLAO
MKKTGIVITDGVGFRNFILSDFIAEAEQQFTKVVILSCLPKTAYEDLNLQCDIIELEVYEESFLTWFFRKTKEVAHLQLHRKGNFGITDNFKINNSKAKTPRGFATRVIYKGTFFFNNEKWIARYNKLQQLSFRQHTTTKKYCELLNKLELDSLFFTHQRPPYIAPLVFAAAQMNIKTIAFIFSWDNLASKGRMAAAFDYYLVWSDLMKKDLLNFYTAILPEQVEIVGTPQFEPYVLPRYGYSVADFYKRFELDDHRPTLLFSCGDVSTSPNDTVYIESIAAAITNDEFATAVNLLVRTSPAEEPKRFAYLAEKYPFIRWNYPQWVQARANHQEAWSQRLPTIADVNDLKSVLEHTAVNINMLSTMSLDYMIFDKPVINTVFGDEINGLANDQRFLKYAHIEHVTNSGATYLALNNNDLINAINEALKNPFAKSAQQKDLLNLQIGASLEGTSKRIAKALYRWS